MLKMQCPKGLELRSRAAVEDPMQKTRSHKGSLRALTMVRSPNRVKSRFRSDIVQAQCSSGNGPNQLVLALVAASHTAWRLPKSKQVRDFALRDSFAVKVLACEASGQQRAAAVMGSLHVAHHDVTSVEMKHTSKAHIDIR